MWGIQTWERDFSKILERVQSRAIGLYEERWEEFLLGIRTGIIFQKKGMQLWINV